MQIIPSIASANQLQIEKEILRLNHQYESLHIDIEDGHFVMNITFGKKMISQIRTLNNIPFSFHLMTTQLSDYLEFCYQMNASHIFIHVESTQYLRYWIHQIKQHNIKVGLAFNPITPIEPYQCLIGEVDAILLMMSEPDGVGEIIQMDVMNKLVHLSPKPPEIWCDGGIGINHVEALKRLGVTHIVMGRALFKQDHPAAYLQEMNGQFIEEEHLKVENC